MSRRGVIAANRAIGTAGRGGVPVGSSGGQMSPMAQELAHAMGIPTQPAASTGPAPSANHGNGWGDAYGGTGLPRQPSVFTDGAFTPYMPVPSVPVDVAQPSGQPLPRREEYRVGWNLPVGQPGTEGLKLADFNTLRTIADLYSVARACIQFLKAQITSLEWEIMPTKDAAKAMRGDKGAMKDFGKRRAAAVKFFKRPDPDYFSWQTWLTDVLEETLVYDALSVVVRTKRGKGLGRGVLGSDLDCLNLISGPTIRPLYDVSGARPRPPAVGYQQYLYGVPRVDLWTMITERDLDESGLRGSEWKAFGGDQLMYVPVTPRRWTPYGFSPVEQALIPIMTGLQKQAYQLDYFREGTIPGVFVSPGGANAEMTSTQIRELQTALNAIAGDPAWKHKILVLPADSHVTPMRSQALADALDEIVMTQTCMGFGVQPMQIGIMPRVSATSSPGAEHQMAKMAGNQQDRTTIRPKVIFLATIMDYVLTEVCNQTDMRFVFDGMEEEEDEETKTNLLINQVEHGLATIDEARDELGKQPFGETKTSDPGWGTATGFQTFAEAEAQAKAQQAAMAQAPTGTVSQGAEPPPSAGGAAGAGGAKKPTKPSPKGPKSDATQSPGHEAAEESSNASSGSGKNEAPSSASAPAKKALKFDKGDRRLSTIASIAGSIAAVIAQIAKAHRDGELDGTSATQQGLAALGTGYAMVMSQAGQHALDDGMTTEDDLAGVDYTGPVGQRTEAQRQYLSQMLRMAATAPELSWLPARANLYASSLHGAYSEGYGTAVQQSHPDYQLVWRLGSSEHCRLCVNRAGKVFTFHTLPGWPGDGGFGGQDAVCLGGQNCKCSIDYIENSQTLASGGNTLQQAGYYAQQNQAISAWRDQVEASTDEFLAGLPNEAGSDVQLRAQSREDLRRELATLLNARIRATGGYGGISVEPQDIPASLISSIIPQYGPIPSDVPLTALMDAIDQFFAMKGARLDLTKTELAGVFTDVIGQALKYSSSQPRDAHGRFAGGGGKDRHGGGGGAATVHQAVAEASPKKDLSAMINRLNERVDQGHIDAAAGDAEVKQITDHFTGEFAGLKTSVHTVTYNQLFESLKIYGFIHDASGERVGTFIRHLNGDGSVTHEELKLRSSVQGRGFSREFNNHAETLYKQYGINRINLHADVDVGGYAWARQGYDWKNEKSVQDALDSVESWVSVRGSTADKADLKAFTDRVKSAQFGSADYPTPYELSQVGWRHGSDTWGGKQGMMGSDWQAVKYLGGGPS